MPAKHPADRRQFLKVAGIAGTGWVLGSREVPGAPLKESASNTEAAEKKTTEDTSKSSAAKSSSSDFPAFQPTTLLTTWWRDPTTTMVIQWVGTAGETADTKVYYKGPTESEYRSKDTTTKPYPLTDFKVYRVELTELEPGSEYSFKIGKASATYKFRTMPKKLIDGFSFITGGDCGHNQHTVNNNRIAALQEPAFAIVGGDLGYDDGRKVDVSLAFLRNYSQQMVTADGCLIPLIACLGNHEVDGGYWAEGRDMRAKAPFFYALFDGLYSETGYNTLDFGDYLSLVLLDTGHTSRIPGAQTEWLERVLRERRDHPHVIPVGHVPAYPSVRPMGNDEKPGTGFENRKHWVPLFDKYRVPVVLEHHDHTFKRSKPMINGHEDAQGVVYLGDGSWGRLRTPQPPEKLPHLLRVEQSYHLTLHRIDGERRFHLALNDQGRVMDVTSTGQRHHG